jgi:uncharacterized protein (UPF0335 family)
MDADSILKDAYRRWLNIEEAKEAAQQDGKELMAELKAEGMPTTKAIRAGFRRWRMQDDAKAVAADEVFEAEVDMVLASLARDAHVRAA